MNSTTGFSDPYAKLRGCDDELAVDGILSEIGIEDDENKRLRYLLNFMGARETFQSGDISVGVQYHLAKRLLISHDWVGMSKNI